MADVGPGQPFPDFELPDHTGAKLRLGEIADEHPLVLCFVRGWWCPKEQVRLRGLVEMQEEIQREYGRLVAVTVDEPYVNGALRAGLGASFPFLSDEDRAVATELDVLERTDETHRPHLPMTYVLDSLLTRPRCVVRLLVLGQPDAGRAAHGVTRYHQGGAAELRATALWSASGVAPIDAGIDAEVIWIRESSEGLELWRGVYEGPIPDEGDDIGLSSVDGRPWLVHRIERQDGRVAIHVRKTGEPHSPRLVKHHMTVPPSVR